MKYFSCQPDSHNAFGSLTNGVLTYFTVDCARYRRVAANGIGDAAELHTPVTGGDAAVGGSAPSQWSGQQPFTASSSSTSHSAGHGVTQHDVHFTTETRMHIQRTLTLPSPFQGTQCFFSMANRTVFGTDMAFIGAANGLLALAVLQEDLLLYVRGKDPQSLREQLQRQHAESSSILRRCSTSDSGVVARRPPSPPAISLTLPSPSRGGGGGGGLFSFPSFTGGAAAAAKTSGSTSSFQGRDPSSNAAAPASMSPHRGRGVVRGLYRRDAPSTITWMRNKPLVLVGYTSGWVEWYEVSISAAYRKELLDPAEEIPYGASVTPGAFAYQALNRDSLTSHVARVAVGGQIAGLRAELVASCVLAEAGALVCSDYFAANGTVAVGSERGSIFLFDADQLEAPLCELQLSTPSAAFLYCHPFLPIVGVLSQSVWTGAEEQTTSTAAAAARRRRDNSPTLHLTDSHNSGVVRPSVGQVDGAIGTCVGSPQRGVTSGKRGPTTFPLVPLQGSRDDPRSGPHQLSSPSGATPSAAAQGAPKPERHVGWHDASPAALMSGGNVAEAFSSGIGATSPLGLYGGGGAIPEVGAASALHSGCLLTFAEYRKDPPPRLLSRTWTGAQPPTPSHRLTQVLQHRMDGAAARYGAYYTFSWKFSFDLELAVGNLEEGALHIVRAARIMDRDAGSDVGDAAEEEDREGSAADGERGVPASAASTASAAHPSSYQVVQDYNVRLPLHSLVNVEYVSAATSSLSALDNAAAVTKAEPIAGCSGMGSTTAEQSLFQRDAERCQRQTALLGAAVDPRCRLGFSSVSPSQASAVAGVLCRPANPLWAGLAVVSMPRGGRQHERGHSGDAHRYVGELDLFGASRGHGGAFGVLYSPASMRAGDGAAGVIGCASASGCAADDGGPLLKENALAAAMRQPFCGDAGAIGGTRYHRRHTGETGNSSGTDATLSRWFYSLAITSVSTQQSHQQRRRERRRLRRDPRAPAITVPSYAAMSTKNEIASAALIAADQRVDLHDALRIGPGNVSCVAVMNAAGEVASVPIEVRAVSAWHEAGSVFVGLGPTLYAADLVSIQGIERLMRRRYAAGFGLSSVANLAAVKEVGGFGSEDVAMLLLYVVTLEAVSLVALSGPVPSLMELLHSSPVTGRGALQREAAARVQARLGPVWRAKMEACVCHEDLCCLLVLQVLRWLPSSLTEEAGQPWQGIVQPPPLSDTTPVLGENSTNVDIERAVAVEVTHGRHTEAAELLLRFAGRSPSYGAMATLLRRPEEAQSMVCNSDPRVCASFRASLTPWLLVVFHCVCSPCDGASRNQSQVAAATEKGLHDDAASVRTVLPPHLYRHSALPFWDRVALAVVMEAGTTAAFTHVMQDILLRECNPVQALLLQYGIHLRTYAAMQEIVDCTGDFQLGACLFARVGVLTTAAALAFPFLLDAEVSAAAATAAATERTAVTSPTARSHKLSAISTDYQLYSYRADGGFGGYGDGNNEGQGRDSVYGCSPFSYLRSSHRRRSSGQLPSSSARDERGSLEEGVTHTARLVLNSALPPPARAPREAISGVRMLPHSVDAVRVSNSLPPGHMLRYGVSPNDAAAGNGHGSGDGFGNAADIDSDDADADVPWVWWAAAYRSFLDDEQAFVRRTTFDVECRQLRGGAFLARDAAAAAMNVCTADAASSSSAAAVASVAGDARAGRYGRGCRSLHRTPPQDTEAVGLRCSSPSPSPSPSPADLVSRSVEQCVTRHVTRAGDGTTSGGGGICVGRSLSAAASWSSPSAPSVFAGPYGGGATHVTSVTPPYASAFMRSPESKPCVCGEQHTGTQLIRSLLSICSTTTTRCCVCLETVRLGSKDVDTAFAWCTSCDHGGHAYHLQSWFRTHRRCPVNGCDCHCDEDSNLY
ncbi:conserved hypothetical protein [Leishmania mexicana MHOM/GT/2001/U1103]|uniref:GATOR2 complex protein MIO zinc-ribbon like domain-containing protein n=1 Tax=Leishmania mexicana (strain MHOM/GT/2001/U1103) TaxID=929439 RepID=E9AXK3_LEIMU|nr:conserved hypothetical protein [Leishmania mexicana MHOM/GT/2001/U1103]CBZ27694.1 conserved hypothetical protein [Leishmania mexicana MHOM/GT/2001/U1103]